MTKRSCPNCGYKYSFIEYFKKNFLIKFTDTIWLCNDCGSELSFNPNRRIVLIIIGIALPIGINSIIREWLQSIGLSNNLSFLVYAIIAFIWFVIVFSHDKFILVKDSRKQAKHN